FVLREYVDRNHKPLIPQLGQWGTPSCVIGIGTGLVATLAGVAGALYGKGITNPKLQLAAVSYGIPAIVTGVASGYFQPPLRVVRLPAPPRAKADSQVQTAAPAGVLAYDTPAGQVYNVVDPATNLL
ncbi:MAG: hypothetical protein PHT84_03640, partial [Candidatus Pacebacteria bacterium]|nr:hypothetical protein [Candidatus Paceibacterota bacterium]